MIYNDSYHHKFMIVMSKMVDSIQGKLSGHWKDLDINNTEFFVLYALDANGPLTIQEIASKVHITSGTMTYVIDKLQEKNYIARVRCEEDRRKIFIEMTDNGKSFWDETLKSHTVQLESIFSHVTEEDMLKLIELMKIVGKG